MLGALVGVPLIHALGSLPGVASVWLVMAATLVLGNLIPVAVRVAQGLLFYPIYRSHARSLAERARQGGRAAEEEREAYVRQRGGTSYAALAVCIALELVATVLLAPVL